MKSNEKETQATQNAEKLLICLQLAIQKLKDENEQLSEVLSYGQVSAGVKNLEMDVAAIYFPETKDGPSLLMGFTWEFLKESDHAFIAEDIIEHLFEAVDKNELPEKASEFILE